MTARLFTERKIGKMDGMILVGDTYSYQFYQLLSVLISVGKHFVLVIIFAMSKKSVRKSR